MRQRLRSHCYPRMVYFDWYLVRWSDLTSVLEKLIYCCPSLRRYFLGYKRSIVGFQRNFIIFYFIIIFFLSKFACLLTFTVFTIRACTHSVSSSSTLIIFSHSKSAFYQFSSLYSRIKVLNPRTTLPSDPRAMEPILVKQWVHDELSVASERTRRDCSDTSSEWAICWINNCDWS